MLYKFKVSTEYETMIKKSQVRPDALSRTLLYTKRTENQKKRSKMP